MKLSAIIVTYFPDINDLVKNIASCFDDVEKIIVWENSKSLLEDSVLLAPFKAKLLFFNAADNVGIATALNYGVRWSVENSFTHILTLDQDSYFEKGGLAAYKKLIEEQKDNHTGVFGVNPISGNQYLFKPTDAVKEVSDTITSGSIFPLTIFEECGLFKDDLFIDAVDYEFCYRVKKNQGYKTIVFPDIILQHKVGYVTKSKWGFKTDNYSAFRTYFIVRNHIVMWRTYGEIFPTSYKKVLIKTHIVSRLIKVILAENDKVKKIRAIFIGIAHGLTGRLGYYKVK